MKITKSKITPRERKLLAGLLELLEKHAELTPFRFMMHTFFRFHGSRSTEAYRDAAKQWKESGQHVCGTVACLLGHLPLVPGGELTDADTDYPGEKYASISWDKYGRRVLPNVYVGTAGHFLFSGTWATSRPRPEDAADRLRFFLKHGGYPAEFDAGVGSYNWTPPATEAEAQAVVLFGGFK